MPMELGGQTEALDDITKSSPRKWGIDFAPLLCRMLVVEYPEDLGRLHHYYMCFPDGKTINELERRIGIF